MAGGKTRKSKRLGDEDFDHESIKVNLNKKNNNDLKEFNSFNFRKEIVLKTDKQKELIKAIHDNHVIFVSGPAGVGKTFLALKGGLELLKDHNNPINKIIITKPIVEAGENIGFLPGTLEEKIAPYLESYYGNLKQLIGEDSASRMVSMKTIDSMPLAYLRGATFINSVAILDEAQNTTVVGLKLFLSRIGENSKIIIMGDVDQTDLPFKRGEISGLEDAFQRFQDIPKVAFVKFEESDIVRHSILIDLMRRYNKK